MGAGPCVNPHGPVSRYCPGGVVFSVIGVGVGVGTMMLQGVSVRPYRPEAWSWANTVRIVVARHLQGRFSRAWSPGPATCPSDSSRTNGLNRTVLGHGLARLVCIATRHPDRFGCDDLVLSRTASHCVSCDDWQTNCSVGQRRLHLHGRAPGVNEQSLVHDSGREAGTRYGPMRH